MLSNKCVNVRAFVDFRLFSVSRTEKLWTGGRLAFFCTKCSQDRYACLCISRSFYMKEKNEKITVNKNISPEYNVRP